MSSKISKNDLDPELVTEIETIIPGPEGPQGPQGVPGIPGPKGDPGTTTWSEINDVPQEFPPESHEHEIGSITGLENALGSKVSGTNGKVLNQLTVEGGAPIIELNELDGTAGDKKFFIVADSGILSIREDSTGNDVYPFKLAEGKAFAYNKELLTVESGGGGEDWKLLETKTMAVLGDQWFSSWVTNFPTYLKVKFVLKGLSLHHQMSGTQAAVMLNLEVPHASFAFKTYGHRFMQMAGTVQSIATSVGRTTIPLLSTNIPSSTSYPHPEISGELIVEPKDFGSGFMPKSIWVESRFMVRNGATSGDIMYEWQKFDLAMGLNHDHSTQIGLSNTGRAGGFTKGIIEIWGILK